MVSNDVDLPPLPDPDRTVDIFGHDCDLFTKSKMQAHARAAVLADRQQRSEQDAKDAARYRWLRKAGAWESEVGLELLSASPEAFDAAVDERMGV